MLDSPGMRFCFAIALSSAILLIAECDVVTSFSIGNVMCRGISCRVAVPVLEGRWNLHDDRPYHNYGSIQGHRRHHTLWSSSAFGFEKNMIGMEDTDADTGNEFKESEAVEFASLGLAPHMVKCTEKLGWSRPTPVQVRAIPAIIASITESSQNGDGVDSGELNLWCQAPTGSGKTGAFALPLVQILLRQKALRMNTSNRRSPNESGRVSVLVLVPTRELAKQVEWVVRDVRDALPNPNMRRGLFVKCLTGGIPVGPQREALTERLASGLDVDVLVATPGRLVDMLGLESSSSPAQTTKQKEETLERKLLEALDGTGRVDATLSHQDLVDLGLDRLDEIMSDDDDGGGGSKGGAGLTLNHQRYLSGMLEGLEYLVIDEADRLLGPRFREEVDPLLKALPDLRRGNEEHEMKTLLFSATYPEGIRPRVEKILARWHGDHHTPTFVNCASSPLPSGPLAVDDTSDLSSNPTEPSIVTATTSPMSNLSVSSAGTTAGANVRLRTLRVEERDRTMALVTLLAEDKDLVDAPRILVFVSTRYAAGHVARKLRRKGVASTELHGGLDQPQRERRLSRFRNGTVRILLATDLAARGLDVVGLDAVINYDLPRSPAEFVHRIGRTGRGVFSSEGVALTFLTAEESARLDLIERRVLLPAGIAPPPTREVHPKFPVNEDRWQRVVARSSSTSLVSSDELDRHHNGGTKGRRKSKKDKLREAAAAAAVRAEA